MPKQRLTALDLRALSSELQSIVSSRVHNIYDINSRILLLRLSLPDQKMSVIIESGYRIHLTSYAHEKSSSPNHFVTKLRKYLNARRLTNLFQLGTDRILVLSFTSGTSEDKTYHLVLEFFSGGNILLVSSNYTILLVLRTFRPEIRVDEDPSQFQAYELDAHYSILERHFSQPKQYEPMNIDRLRGIFSRPIPNEPEEVTANALISQPTPERKKKSKPESIHKALVLGAPEYGAQLVEHVIQSSSIDGNIPINQITENSTMLINATNIALTNLLSAFSQAEEIVRQCSSNRVKGYITSLNSAYTNFMPFKPTNLPSSVTVHEYDNFNLTLDTYYSHFESSKLEQKRIQASRLAQTRLEALHQDHSSRLQHLRSIQDANELKATLLETNLQKVDEAIKSINGLLGQGMDWGDMTRLVNMERERGNGVAEIILDMKFEDGKIVLGLRPDDGNDEDEDEDEEKELVQIEVDLGLSAYANAREYYEKKKWAAEKESRTAQSSSKALKNAERKINTDLSRTLKQEKQLIKPIRQQKWFEKFYWFISSEGYIVVGARDALQTELLVRKYFRKGDVYVHSDLDNSSVVLIKNVSEVDVVPPTTLSQAGTLALATSRAWDAKQVTSAWWVAYSQIVRMEDGYQVTGKRNYLPPTMLGLGYGVLWATEDEETMERHARPLLTNQSGAIANKDIQEVSGGKEESAAESDRISTTNESHIEPSDKYNLEEYGSAADEESATEIPSESSQSTKQFLSAKQRRDLKKVNKLDSPQATRSPPSSSKSKPVPLARGKKGKLKKMKARYADQSDEERELVQKLLGAKPIIKNPPPKAHIPVAAPQPQPEKLKTKNDPPLPPRSVNPRTDEPPKELDLSTREFISAPRSGDEISNAVTICAPWSALTRYKYKVKITPGSSKKGKAARSAIAGFLSMGVDEKGENPDQMSPREKELLQSLKDEEIIPCIWPKTMKLESGTGGKRITPAKGKGKK